MDVSKTICPICGKLGVGVIMGNDTVCEQNFFAVRVVCKVCGCHMRLNDWIDRPVVAALEKEIALLNRKNEHGCVGMSCKECGN